MDDLLTTVTHRAMATQFAVMLPRTESRATEAVLESLEMLDGIEAALTIYQDESEISRVNRDAENEPVELSQETFSLLQKAITWSERTNGAFDITAGPLVETWGFSTRSRRKPSDAEIATAKSKVGYQDLILDTQRRSVQFAKPGMSINLGAIGKGDAVDRLAAKLIHNGVENFLIHGGNSSVLARGDQHAQSNRGWKVGISHPTKVNRRLKGIWLRNQSLATSGSGKQFFHHQGKRFGHVIDPRTGYHAGDLLSLTVLNESAAAADACATGFFVAGTDAIRQAFDNGDCLGPMLGVRAAKRQDVVELEVFGSDDGNSQSDDENQHGFDWVED